MLGTGILAASNYTMQVLSAPTRTEVNKAHKKRDWVEIGVPGLRNLWGGRIKRERVVVWTLLLVSSLPLHLL